MVNPSTPRVAIRPTVAAGRTGALVPDAGPAGVEALHSGYRWALAVGAALLVIAVAPAVRLLRDRPATAAPARA